MVGGVQAQTQGIWTQTPMGCPGPGPGGVSQHVLRKTPQQRATAAGSTHPTGMHSCFKTVFLLIRSN